MGARGRKSAAEIATSLPESPAEAVKAVRPPRPLGEHGMALWESISAEYDISSASTVEILAEACAALDRAEACADAIRDQGVTVIVNDTPRDHPLIKHELAARAFVARTIIRLEGGS